MNNVEPMSPARQRHDAASDQPHAVVRSNLPEDDEIDLGQLFRTLWRGKWWLILSFILAVTIGGYYAFVVAVPVYTTSAYVTLENRREQVVDLKSVMSGISGDQTSINTEVEVLKSRQLGKKLVQKLNLVEDPEFNQRLRVQTGFSVGQAITLLRELILGAPTPKPEPGKEAILDDVTSATLDKFSISNIRQSYVFQITATTESAGKSAVLANTLADLYILNQLDVKFEATKQATDWLTGRVADLQVKLEAAETTVKEFSSKSDLISAEALDALNRQAKDTRERLQTTTERSETRKKRIAALEQVRDTGDRDRMAEIAANQSLSRSLKRVRDGKMPDTLFDTQFDQFIESERSGFARVMTQISGLKKSLVEIDTQIKSQSKDLVELQQLTREAEAARLIYEYFLGRLKETSAQQGIQQADSRVLSNAVIPTKPSAPRKSLILALSGMLGLFAGAGLLLLREMAQNTFRSAEQLERATGYTVMGQIPLIPGRKRKDILTYLASKPTSAASEAIRNLRTSIMLSNVDKPPKVIMVTSCVPGEGKTSMSLALAQSFSGLDKRVLLVEGDLRRLVFSQYFLKPKKNSSLLSVLSGDKTIAEAVQPSPQIGADVLLGEKTDTNVADMFASEKFTQLISDAADIYDIVIIDTPPVLVVPDARTIAQTVDTIVFAVHWDATEQSQITEALRMFESVNIRPSGLVLNKINMKGMKRYGYSGRYGAYSKYGRKYYTN